jgi:hypothetical protein
MVSLSARSAARRHLGRAARRAGRAAMGSELAGRPGPAGAGYGLAYRLSVMAERL